MTRTDAPRVARLANGVRIATHAMAHVRTAALGIWVGAGSRHEGPSEQGLAHFLEHMAFKGTARRPAREIVGAIERVGGDINASTGLESTAYTARVMAEDVPLALDVLADILRHARFDAADITLERGVILQELAAALDDPEDLSTDLLQAAAFPDQPLGRAILGTPDSLTRIDAPALRRFTETQVAGPNVVVSAAGLVDHDAVVALAEALLGDLPANAPSPAMPARFAGGLRAEPDVGDQATMAFALPGVSLHDEQAYTAAILASALGGGMSSRLFQTVREERGLAYGVSAFSWGMADTGLIGFEAATEEARADELADVLNAEVDRAADDLADDEVATAAAQARASFAMGLEHPMGCAERAARHLLQFDRIVPVEEALTRIAAVDAQACRMLLGEALHDGRRAVSLVGPVRDAAAKLAGTATPQVKAA